MEVGGVILGVGMELNLADGDYSHGTGRVRFIVGGFGDTAWRDDTFNASAEACTCCRELFTGTTSEDWVLLMGAETPPTATHWRPRMVLVRISALKRVLALV